MVDSTALFIDPFGGMCQEVASPLPLDWLPSTSQGVPGVGYACKAINNA